MLDQNLAIRRDLFIVLYKNAWIFQGSSFKHGSFRVEDGKFVEILDEVPDEIGLDLENQYVIPGLVDVHIHGAVGADFSDGDYDGLVSISEYLAQNGVTSFAPTSMTLPYAMLERAFNAGKMLHEHRPENCAKVMGIHMEGPFLSASRKGAQNGIYLKKPDINFFQSLYYGCSALIRIVDLAPELAGSESFVQTISPMCKVSIAHTDATYEEATVAFQNGADHVTHLFNCMPSLHHRNPGVIAAASDQKKVTVELICDGNHVHPSMIRMAYKVFLDRICLVSDALRCTGMKDGKYEFGGQFIILKNGYARLENGTIAGSVTNLYDCMKKAVSYGIPIEAAINSATMIPARVLGREKEIGSIEPGKDADFVVCTPELEKREVYINGKRIS